MRRVISFWSLILTILIFAGVASAVKTSLWEQQNRADFESGKPKDLSLTSTGDAMLSLKIDAFTKMKETQVWALVEDSAGNLYAGYRGTKGKSIKLVLMATPLNFIIIHQRLPFTASLSDPMMHFTRVQDPMD